MCVSIPIERIEGLIKLSTQSVFSCVEKKRNKRIKEEIFELKKSVKQRLFLKIYS